MHWLNYHHLYYFYVIAKEGGITQATRSLKLAQSTLSAQLKQFEEQLGSPVFERKNRQLVLTDIGRQVFKYANEIFSLGEELKDTIRDIGQNRNLQIQVGIVDSIPKKLSRDLFKVARSKFDVRMSIIEGRLSFLLQELDSHRIDLVISNDKPITSTKNKGLHAKQIGEMPVLFVAAPQLRLSKDHFPANLSRAPFILPTTENPLRKEIDEFIALNQVEPHIVAEIDDLELIRLLVLDGNGVAAVPLPLVDEDIKAKTLTKLGSHPLCHERLWLITAHRFAHNPVAKMLGDTFYVKT